MNRVALVAGAVLVLLAGCSPSPTPLIQVGSQTVTVADYERAARGAQAQYPGIPSQAKATLVGDLVQRAILLELAHREGRDSDAVVVTAMHHNQRRALVQALYARLASPVQRVSEAEALAMFEARKQEAEVWLLHATTRDRALAALERIRAGEDFSDVSRSVSAPGLLPPGGNMGLIAPGSLPDPLDHALRTLPEGSVGGPFEVREGWFLLKVTKRQPREQGTYKAWRAGMYDLLRQRKQRAAIGRAYTDLRAEWQYQLAPGGSQLLFRVISPVDPMVPTIEMKAMPLATYAGGRYTLEDALTDLQDAEVARPPAQMLPALEIWIEQQTMLRVAEREARRRHLDEEPDLLATLRNQREQMLLEGVYQAAVATVPPPGPEQVRAEWDRVKGQFMRVSEVRVAVVTAPDTALAGRVMREQANTGSLAEAARAVDASLSVSEQTLHFPTPDPAWQALQPLFTQLQPEAWFGPEPFGTGYRILQLLDRRIEEQSFEKLPEATKQNIASNAAERAREDRFREFTDSLAAVFQPHVDPKRLASLRWPVQDAPAGP